MAAAKWKLETEYIQSCNCDYGCPCNFNAYPTRGHCEALLGFNVRKGSVGGTKLDGVKFAWGLWWPKAIHEGNGIGRVYVDPKATPAQKKAIEELTSGKYGGGHFAIFPQTLAKSLPAKSARIDWKWAGYDSSVAVDGVGGVRSTHIKNPVTNDNFEGKVVLPGGIAWKDGDVTSVDWSLRDGEAGFNMEHRKTSGFVSTVTYTEKGPA